MDCNLDTPIPGEAPVVGSGARLGAVQIGTPLGSHEKLGLVGVGGVLFLDFDGVLNSRNWYHERLVNGKRPATKTEQEHHEMEIDPKAVAQLDRIIRETGCSVVISSTWRRGLGVGYLLRVLVNRGLSKDHWDNFIGKTPVLDGRLPSGLYTAPERGHEIQAWLDSHPEKFERVVILDDDADMAHLLPKLVGCNSNEGLTVEKADIAIGILSGRRGCGAGESEHERHEGKVPNVRISDREDGASK